MTPTPRTPASSRRVHGVRLQGRGGIATGPRRRFAQGSRCTCNTGLAQGGSFSPTTASTSNTMRAMSSLCHTSQSAVACQQSPRVTSLRLQNAPGCSMRSVSRDRTPSQRRKWWRRSHRPQAVARAPCWTSRGASSLPCASPAPRVTSSRPTGTHWAGRRSHQPTSCACSRGSMTSAWHFAGTMRMAEVTAAREMPVTTRCGARPSRLFSPGEQSRGA
mmetsp:Transcript_21930/g.68230  ORF Transcript_21930/g.68230 Transcript_21930/m.68230 type:complete len:218 (+) Transcript_21930:788-1441(+)